MRLSIPSDNLWFELTDERYGRMESEGGLMWGRFFDSIGHDNAESSLRISPCSN
jgi:hypothetical protein